jgi:hypothetical protein
LSGHFETGGAWGVEEIQQEGLGGFIHGVGSVDSAWWGGKLLRLPLQRGVGGMR